MADNAAKTVLPNIKLKSYESLFGESAFEGAVSEVFVKDLYDFKNHPFQVNDDEDMQELIQSIKDKGILVPLIVRPMSDDGYEIIAGHRRKYAAEIVGLIKVPAIVRDLSDEDAVDCMIYSNIHRMNVLPSEKAKAYRLQTDIMKHRGKKGTSTPDSIGKKYGDNARKVQRYIRLTFLLPALLELVDKKKVTLQAGYFLSFLGEPEQGWVLEIYQHSGKLPSPKVSLQLRDDYTDQLLTRERTEKLILGHKPQRNVTLSAKRLDDIFSSEYNAEQIEQIIYQLLNEWKKELNQSADYDKEE